MMDWVDDALKQLFSEEFHKPEDDKYNKRTKIAIGILIITVIVLIEMALS